MHNPETEHLRESAAVASGLLSSGLPDLFQAFCQPTTREVRKSSVTDDMESAGDITVLRLQAENKEKKSAIDTRDSKRGKKMERPSSKLSKLCCN
jgi:hypothetical protein